MHGVTMMFIKNCIYECLVLGNFNRRSTDRKARCKVERKRWTR